MKRPGIHRESWRRLLDGATKEDRRLRASIWWSLAIAAVIALGALVSALPF